MKIRRAVEGDLAAVGALLEQLGPAAGADRPRLPPSRAGRAVPSRAGRTARGERQAAWNDAIRHPGYFAWVADVDGRPAGFIDLFVLPDVSHGRDIGIISNLIVDARVRGQGIGERLLHEAVEQCKTRGAIEVHVWTDFANTPALGLYRKLGFVDRALLLERELAP